MSDERNSLERLARTIDQATIAEVATLVHEAQMEAREKVRATLVDAFAEQLLDLAEEELRRRSAQIDIGVEDAAEESPTVRREPGEPVSFVSYVYGVVDAKAVLAPGIAGLDDGHEVFLIRGESVAAVASLVPSSEFGEEALQEHLNDLAWIERRARRHEQVLDWVREQTTLVPMRLCTIYRDERSVLEMLAREHDFLADALQRLQGRTEWGVKMYVVSDPPDSAEQDHTEAHTASRTGAGADYLRGKQLQQSRRERAHALVQERCEQAHSELTQAAVEAKFNPVQPRELTGRDEPMVFNGVYLVDDAALESFSSVVRALQLDLAENGLELELSGPWTPYNFVNSSVEVGR